MSTYSEKFKKHTFHAIWAMVLQKSNELIKEAGDNVHPDLIRLNTVATFINEQIEIIVPEMSPLSLWDKFQIRSNEINQQLDIYNNNHESNLHNLVAANEAIDELLTLMQSNIAMPSDQIKKIQEITISYDKLKQTIDSYKSDIINTIQMMRVHESSALSYLEQIENTRNTIAGTSEHIGIMKEIENARSTMLMRSNEIDQFHKRLIGEDANNASVAQSVQQIVDSINDDKKKLTDFVNDANNIVSELSGFQDNMLGSKDAQGQRSGGLSGDLDNLKSALLEFEQAQKTKYDELVQQITSLLPNATSAGLASAYSHMRETFKKPIQNWTYLFLSVMFLIIGLSFTQLSSTVGTWDEILKKIVHHLPIYLPLLWIALFAIKRRGESIRLEQEYAHKEAIAKSYEGYKRQIENLGEKTELLAKLMDGSIDAITFNASKTLEKKHGESVPTIEMLKEIKEEIKEIVKTQSPTDKK